MSDGSDSDFEQLGFSDVESVAGGPEDKESKNLVVVELPAPLRSDTDSSELADQSSLGSSSFVMKVGNLKIASKKDDESSTWSQVDGSVKNTDPSSPPGTDDASVATGRSSTISGFDILSLSGASKRRCKACSFLNGEDDGVCGACGRALVANPCQGVDEQIAKNLQLKEERFALEQLQEEEKKRKTLAEQSILVRSQVLVNDVASFVKGCKGHGFDTLPEASLVVLASRFIDCADTCIMNGGRVTLAYHFSRKFEWRMTQIRQDGLGSLAPVSTNLEAAYKYQSMSAILDARGRPFPRQLPRRFPSLASIPEGDPSVAGGNYESNRLGWIVATIQEGKVSCLDDETTVPLASGSAIVKTLNHSYEALPLICFDAALRKNDIIRRLLNGKFGEATGR